MSVSRYSSRCHPRSEEHTSELQSPCNLVCRLLLEKKKNCRARCMQTGGHHQRHVWCMRWSAHHVASVSDPWTTQHPPARRLIVQYLFFFFNDTATTEIYTLSLHDALPI